MRTRNALLFSVIPAIALVVHCASQPKRSTDSAAAPAPAASIAEAGIDADTGAGGAAGEEGPPRPDPALVKKALDRAGASAPDEAETLGIRFEVVEMGPNAVWGMAVVNRGTGAVEVAFDPRLLVLEIEPPPDPNAKKWAPKPKKRVCSLPAELRPTRVDDQFVIRLEPGHGMVEQFDPRLYCLPDKGVSPFVAGAKVTAHFGWAPKTKTVWKKGKKEEELLPQTDPFVAELAPPAEDEHHHESQHEHAKGHGHGHGHGEGGAARGAGERTSDAGVEPEPTAQDAGADGEMDRAVKELVGTTFELGPDYAPPKPEAPPEPIALELRNGSDARSETEATVTLNLVNRSGRARQVYFRREFVSFEVSGPDGVTICDPQPDTRAPDRQAFTLIGAGGSLASTSRLVELCPDDTFARPGLYVVRAQLDTFANGAEFGFDAYVGHLVSERAVVVRIRTGSLPFPGPRTVEPVKVGSP